MINKDELLKEFSQMSNCIFEKLKNINEKNINNLDIDNAILVIVDMNNGFAKYGSLYSPRIKKLINPIVKLANKMSKKNVPIICFSDRHSEDSTEFLIYPKHCLINTDEGEIIDELIKIKGIEIIHKNSTNGFFAEKLQLEFEKKSFIIVGNCTDICVYQFAITLKTFFNQINQYKKVIVPMNFVDTFDLEGHKANFMNYVFLNSMIENGIEVINLKID